MVVLEGVGTERWDGAGEGVRMALIVKVSNRRQGNGEKDPF